MVKHVNDGIVIDSVELENGNQLILLNEDSEINILINDAREKLNNDKSLLAIPLVNNTWVVRDGYGDVGVLKLSD